MALYGAFSSSMLAMMSQSYALDVIGSNVANVGTVGYKRNEVNFSSLLSSSINNTSDIGGVAPNTFQRIDAQGSITASNRQLDSAIAGSGFYVLNSERDGSGETFYTRNGSFHTVTGDTITVTADDGVSTIETQEAYLTNQNGYYVMGWLPNTDGSFTTTATVNSLSALRVDSYAFQSTGIATTLASLDLNLPANDSANSTHNYAIEVYDSDGTQQVVTLGFEKQTANNSWTVTPSWQDPPTAQVDTVTLAGTIEAGDVYSVTVAGTTVNYTVAGTEPDISAVRDGLIALLQAEPTVTSEVTIAASGTDGLTLTATTAGTGFTATATATNGGVTADNTNTSVTTTANDDGARTGTATALTFNSDGELVTGSPLAISITWAGGSSVNMSLDMSEMSQYSGNFTPHSYSQNGYGAGLLESISFDSQGQLIGHFSNAQSRPVYRLGLAHFSNPNGLEPTNASLYRQTPESGSATIFAPDENSFAFLSPNSLEQSNVTLEDEFSTMIMTQNAYNSAATVFRTVDEMTTVARDLKR